MKLPQEQGAGEEPSSPESWPDRERGQGRFGGTMQKVSGQKGKPWKHLGWRPLPAVCPA